MVDLVLQTHQWYQEIDTLNFPTNEVTNPYSTIDRHPEKEYNSFIDSTDLEYLVDTLYKEPKSALSETIC